MTDFTETRRHYCRSPRCRCKLPAPVSNPHRAFCTRGCHASFYLKRCLVCENDKPAGRARLLCRRPQCRSKYSRDRSFFTFGYAGSGIATDSSKSAHFTGLKTGGLGDRRPWRIVAGEPGATTVFRAAAAPDGPGCQWKGGAFERAEAASRAALRAHFAELAKRCLIQPHHPPINVLGGDKFPDAPAINLSAPSPPDRPTAKSGPSITSSDDLSIPTFLILRTGKVLKPGSAGDGAATVEPKPKRGRNCK